MTAGGGGAVAAVLLGQRPISEPRPPGSHIFYLLYAEHELPFFVLIALFALGAALVVRRGAGGGAALPAARGTPAQGVLALGSLAFAVAAWVGSRVVLHDFPFSMDEYNAVFQTRILAAGQIAAGVPVEWQRFAVALTPVFVAYKPDQALWASGYLPGYAAIRAAFALVGADAITNPVLGALSLPAIAAAARRLWPGHPRRAWVAVLFLGTSSQFLLTSMSWYSMPAHLLLNLVWLTLYLRGDRLGLALAPFVGVIALALHNPFPHALFAAPFALRMVRDRRWARLAYFGAVYVPGALACLAWLRFMRPSGGATLDVFALPGVHTIGLQLLHLSLVVSWQSAVVALFALVAVLRWRELGAVERDLVGGLVLTAAFYFAFPLSQGHGWGYRYVYNVLGNLILLAVVGAAVSRRALGEPWTRGLVAASVVLTLLVQWPLRLAQAERVVRPFARASHYVRSQAAEAVVVSTDSAWYARDIVRNDPFLGQRPKILAAPALSAADRVELQRRLGGRVRIVGTSELARLGLPTYSP